MISIKTFLASNRALLDHLPLAALVVDANGLIQYANLVVAGMLNAPEGEITNRSWAGLDAHLTLINWKKKWQQVVTNGSVHYRTELSTDGRYLLPVRITIILLEEEAGLVLLEDESIDLLRNAQLEQLSEQQELAYWSYDVVRSRWNYSEKFYQLLAFTEEEKTDSSILNLLSAKITPEQQDKLESEFQAALTNGRFFTLELTLANGQQLYLRSQVLQNDLHPTHVIGTASLLRSTPEASTIEAEQNPHFELTQYSTDNAPDLIFWTNPEGEILYANHLTHHKLGYPLGELNSAPVTRIAPYFTGTAKDAFWQELREKKEFTREYSIYGRSKQEVIISASVRYLKFADQEIACSFCRDISNLQKEQLRQRLMAFTLDNAQDMVLWVKPDGHIRYFNDSFLRKSGYTEAQISSAISEDFFPYATPERRKKLWEILRKDGQYEMETYLKTAAGEQIPVKASFNYIQYEGEELNSVYFRDWSKKKQRELQIKLSQTVLESASEAIAWLEQDGTVTYLNDSALSYLGGQRQDWLSKDISLVFPKLQLAQIQPGETLEYHMPSTEGKTVYLELTFSQVSQGDRHFLTIVGRNFTERYLRRKELETAYSRIEDLSARLQEENIVLREDVAEDYSINNIITVSPKYQKVLQQVAQVAETDTTVLILGETGTGKELLARAIHSLSEREEHTLIKVNCAALPENLIESELFGHEKGAFTGAQEQKKGRFELAHKSTIFLDEVGELPLALQAKLLRVLQEGEFERVGGNKTINVDVRLIAATNRSLEDMVKKGSFRADLYYRLHVFPIVNMPLRERPEDIPVLAQHFVKKFAQRQGKKIRKISSTDLQKLKTYRFPGNVRELENIIERAVVLCNGEVLNVAIDKGNSLDMNEQIFQTFDEMQRNYIIHALRKTDGRITGPKGAGRLLGLNDRTLMSKIRKFNIEKREYLV